VARLGGEAGDALDVLLCSAHQASMAPEAPSLTAFLARYEPTGGREPSGHTVKRDLDAGRDEVRVMTVHGSKGLEAAIVVVIDGCEELGRDPALIQVPLPAGGKVPVWSPSKGQDCVLAAQAREALHERAREEHNRLLYVAMTRAKDRLVMAPYFTGRKDAPENAWCEMIRRALTKDVGGFVRTRMPYGPLEADVWREGDPVPSPRSAEIATIVPAIDEPAWLRRPLDPEPEPAPPIRPSSALGAADRMHRPGDGPFAPQARRRGTLIHALLERLPGVSFERWAGAARAYVAARASGLSEAEREGIVRDALGVLTHDALQPLFGPGSRAEAPIAGRISTLSGDVAVSGQIDRLAVLEREILLADFKTSVRPPDPEAPVPAAYLAQLALYRTLLAEIFPGRTVRAFLIWTSGPAIRELTEAEMGGALALIKAA
jgi:ATP-dependent helicase/nuclease subunit A